MTGDIVDLVTIGWFPRERFVLAAESLATLLANTPPCRLVIVDPATPEPYRRALLAELGEHPAEIVQRDEPLLPAEAKNLVLDRVHTPYVALVENDVLFTPGWLEGLVAACERAPADVAAPVIFDGRERKEHFDKHLGRIEEAADGRLVVRPMEGHRNEQGRRFVHFVEQHCLVFRTSTFDRIGRFDEDLNTRDEVDLSVALWRAGCQVVLEPSVGVHYVPPSWRPADDELPFYRHRWDLERAASSRSRIRRRWNLVDTPGDLGFVRYRNLIARLPEVRAELEELTARGGRAVLLDDGDWFGTDVTDGLGLLPFPERSGVYLGYPTTDDDAVAEVDRVLDSGARWIVVGYPAFWWFDHLPGMAARLSERCRAVRDDDLLRVYEPA